jgi:hypothetical protein
MGQGVVLRTRSLEPPHGAAKEPRRAMGDLLSHTPLFHPRICFDLKPHVNMFAFANSRGGSRHHQNTKKDTQISSPSNIGAGDASGATLVSPSIPPTLSPSSPWWRESSTPEIRICGSSLIYPSISLWILIKLVCYNTWWGMCVLDVVN